ncbi:PAS domain S-box protein (plasmid) [Halorussus salilacus]|uniref:PAS domain-containing protein n=1 Tax=Halorussus salilacus TaxID=2953750 RepID=UPI0020A06054|nr:PAS domain S-box protein [Halorussus salilacus]USZ69792.1 PAS domain S-box protein [Halorussus salilacus]
MDSERPRLVETLDTLDDLGVAGEPVTADELADELGCSREAAAERLDELVEWGDLEAKSVGEDGRVWWRSTDATGLDRARFRSLVQTVDEYAIFMLDTEGDVVTWNPGANRIKGYDADEIIGRHFSTFYIDEAVESGVPDRNLRVAAERGSVEDEGWRVRKDGTRFWANVVITAIRDDDGTLRGFAKVTRDMTDRREREEQLRRERDQTEQLLETSPVAISVRDAEGDVVLANEQTQDLLDTSESDLRDGTRPSGEVDIYDSAGEPVAADDLPAVDVVETGDPVYDRELLVEKSDGERRWYSVNAAPVFGPDGDLERVITAGEDVTEIKRRERELETELGGIFGRISDAFYALDEEYRFTHVNERAEELLQHSEEELLDAKLWDVFPGAAEIDAVRDSFETAMETQEPTSYELYFDELGFWVEANVYPSETGVSVYFRDVSDRIARERELRESERRYRTLAEHFPNGLVTLFDADLRYKLAAGQAFERLDVTPESLEGRTPTEAWGEEVGESLEALCSSALDGDHESVEVSYAGRQWVVHAVPITDADGTVFAGLTMAQDITERKEREQRLERFASVISHGLRNPLEIAQIYLNMAREEGDADDFEQVEDALDRMETIIQNLLTTTVGGQTVTDPDAIGLSSVSERAWQTVETGDATLRTDGDLGEILADAEQLQSALESLFRNSVEHGGDGVEVRVGRLDGGFYVEDDGPGIPPERREEVFEYGYTSASGTGIGLAVVRDIVAAHGWEIAATDAADGGARFEVRGVEGASDADSSASDA